MEYVEDQILVDLTSCASSLGTLKGSLIGVDGATEGISPGLCRIYFRTL